MIATRACNARGHRATAVARPVNKAPERGTAIATPACNDGGACGRVPPASDSLFLREGSQPDGRDANSVRSTTPSPFPEGTRQSGSLIK